MINFEKLNKAVNVICRINSTICLKHVVDITNVGENGNRSSYGFYYESKGHNGNLMFNNNGYISLESKKMFIRDGGNISSPVIKIKLTAMDLPLLTNALNIATTWIIENNNVFNNDSLNRPVSVKDPSLKTQCPLTNEDGGLIIKPCIINDVTSIKYQGISLSNSNKGQICDFTVMEFMMFKNYLLNSLTNLYSNNLLLAMHTMQYCEYKNMMEVLNKK